MFDGVRNQSERERLDAFRALAADLAPRDLQDLMSYPFFCKRVAEARGFASVDRPICVTVGELPALTARGGA